jgi:hypothetical protein
MSARAGVAIYQSIPSAREQNANFIEPPSVKGGLVSSTTELPVGWMYSMEGGLVEDN